MASEVKKIKSYTIISNSLLRDPRKIGSKAIGVMSFMISLPKNWNFSVKGLAKCIGDGEKSVKRTLKKLEALGYLTRIRERDEKGCFTKNKYILYSEPRVVKKGNQGDKKKIESIGNKSKENIDFYPEAQKVLVDKNGPKVQKVLVDKSGQKVQKVLVDKSGQKRRVTLENIDVYPASGFPALGSPTLVNPTQINTKEIITKEIKEKEINKEKETSSFSLKVVQKLHHKNKEAQNFCSSFENIDVYPEAQKGLVDKNVPEVPEVQKVLVDKNAKKYRTTLESIGAYPGGQKVLMDKNSPEVQKVLVDKNAKKYRTTLENIAVYPGGQNALAEKGRQINTKEINTKINNKKERKENLNDNSLFKRENKNEIKKISAEKNSTEKKKISFDEIIENYTQNEKLRAELKEHLRVRKAKRAALTDHALELSLKRLDSIANSDEEKIEIVQNAIMRGWTMFYPLRSSYNINSYEKTMVKTNSVFSASNYNIDNYEKTMDVFDAQVKKEEEDKKKQEQEQAKLKEILARDHDKNVERYGKQFAEDLETSESIEDYYDFVNDYERRMSKGLLPNGDYPPELSYLENNLFESPEEEARVIEHGLSGARRH